MSLNESDTRAKRIDPALHARGWTEDLIRREETAGAIEDGYLAACEIHRFDLFHDNKTVNERESGVTRNDLEGKQLVDAVTGTAVGADVAKEVYGASDIEDKLLMPERVAAMTCDLFTHLLSTGGPEQKTIIFCRRDRHADDVATALNNLPDAGRSALLVRQLEDMAEFDLYDVLAELGYGMAPRTRTERAEAFTYKNGGWLSGLPANTAATLKALPAQFGRSGTEGLENPGVFEMPEVVRAGGLSALKGLGKPVDVLRETKVRVFSA